MFRIGSWIVDPALREVSSGKKASRVSPKAMAVLLELEGAAGRVLSRAELLERVWPNVTVGEEVLTQAITELRRAFGDKARDPQIIETVHKSGYRLRTRSEPVGEPAKTEEPPQEAAAPVAEAERKRITVLACDLGPAGAALAVKDPEAADRVFGEVATAFATAAGSQSGVMMSRLNDRLVFVFGAPAALEDHAVLATSAAAALPGALASCREAAHTRQDLRIALSSGEVVVRSGSGAIADLSAVGQPAAVAEALLRATPPGHIHLDGGTRERAGTAIEVIEVAGNPELFRLMRVADSTSRFSRGLLRGLTRFTGRALEIELLRHSARLAAEGSGQIIAVSGEPGIGKSRLFHELLGELPDTWLKLHMGTSSAEDAPSRALAAMVRSLFGIKSADNPDAALKRLYEELGERRDLAPALADLLYLPAEDQAFAALDPEDRLLQTQEAVSQLLVGRAATRPVAMVVEDLHWIGSRTERLLKAIMTRVPNASILLLLNWRPEYRPPWDSVPAFTHRRLEALSVDDGAELVRALEPDAPEDYADWLSRRSQGNPLFIEECARAIGPRLPDPESAPVPETVHEVLAARIDRLAADEKSLLQVCAVIGREADLDVITAASGHSPERVLDLLARLNMADFVFETGATAQRRFTLKHAMTQDVAYSGLLSERRASLHRRVAEAIEAGTCGPEDAAALARHWTEAGEASRAVPYWLTAGQDAVAKSANGAAIRWLEAGLSMVPALPPEQRDAMELKLLVELGVPLGRQNGVGSELVGDVYRRADKLWRRLENAPEAVPAAFGLWLYHCARSDFRSGKAIADDLLNLANASGEPHSMVQARHAQWGTLFDLGHFRQSLSHIEALLADGRPAGLANAATATRDRPSAHDPFVCAYGHGALALWIQGYSSRAADYVRRSREVAEELDHPASTAHALLYAIKLLLCRREPQPIDSIADELARLAAAHGLVEYGVLAAGMVSWAKARAGDDDGLDQLCENLATYRSYGRIGYEAKLDAECALLCAERGRLDEAQRRLDNAFEVSRSGQMTYWLAEFHRVCGAVALLQSPDATDAAELQFREAMRIADSQGAVSLGLRAAASMAQLYQRIGRVSDALDLLDYWLGQLPERDASHSEAFDMRDALAAGGKTS